MKRPVIVWTCHDAVEVTLLFISCYQPSHDLCMKGVDFGVIVCTVVCVGVRVLCVCESCCIARVYASHLCLSLFHRSILSRLPNRLTYLLLSIRVAHCAQTDLLLLTLYNRVSHILIVIGRWQHSTASLYSSRYLYAVQCVPKRFRSINSFSSPFPSLSLELFTSPFSKIYCD